MSEKPMFTPFSWFRKPTCHHTENFISDIKDIANGLETLLQLLERDNLAGEDGDSSLLDDYHTHNLLRLAIASTKLLGKCADREIHSINNPKA